MRTREKAVKLLQNGLTPVGIAHEMNVTVNTVDEYLLWAVGKGLTRRSDIIFTFSPEIRGSIESIISATKSTYWSTIVKEARKKGVTLERDDVVSYLVFRDPDFFQGDMYDDIRTIEIELHNSVRKTLEEEHGTDWWRKGVPEEVRVECVTLKERDPEPADEAYCYTSFMHLSRILDKQWKVFTKTLPWKLSSDRKNLMSRLARLNRIRNAVMHPVKNISLDEEDFVFVREFRRDLIWVRQQ